MIELDKNKNISGLNDLDRRTMLGSLMSDIIIMINEFLGMKNSKKNNFLNEIFITLFNKNTMLNSLKPDILERNFDLFEKLFNRYFEYQATGLTIVEHDTVLENLILFYRMINDYDLIVEAYKLIRKFIGLMKLKPESNSYSYSSPLLNITSQEFNLSNEIEDFFPNQENFIQNFTQELLFDICELNSIYSNYIRFGTISINHTNQKLFKNQRKKSKLLSFIKDIIIFDKNGKEFLKKSTIKPLIIRISLLEPKGIPKSFNLSKEYSELLCGNFDLRDGRWIKESTPFLINQSWVACEIYETGLIGAYLSTSTKNGYSKEHDGADTEDMVDEVFDKI